MIFITQVLTVGALHKVDSSALRAAAIAWHDEFAPLPKPLLVVNIGGPTSNNLTLVFLVNLFTPLGLLLDASDKGCY